MLTGTPYPSILEWSDDRLIATYRRLSRDLRREGYDPATTARMCTVEARMRERGLDPQLHAREIEDEIKS